MHFLFKKYRKKIFFFAFVIIAVRLIFNPKFNTVPNYDYIKLPDLWNSFHVKTIPNFTVSENTQCIYTSILLDERVLALKPEDEDLVDGHHIKEGGDYKPTECKPLFSTAIIVPYRGRAEQLRAFLVYIHTFLRRQLIHYRLYIVEQVDSQPFNRGKLLNIGAWAAMRAGFPCLILHNVDLQPLQIANLYACSKQPRHLSSSIDKFRYVLPYTNMIGGVLAITSKQFKAINGMSNEYYDWGGEDDDFYVRIIANSLHLWRLNPNVCKYHMLKEPVQYTRWKSSERLKSAKERMSKDGLSSLKFSEVSTVLHPLFTHIMVDL